MNSVLGSSKRFFLCSHFTHFTLGSFNNYDDVLAFRTRQRCNFHRNRTRKCRCTFLSWKNKAKVIPNRRNHQNDSTKILQKSFKNTIFQVQIFEFFEVQTKLKLNFPFVQNLKYWWLRWEKACKSSKCFEDLKSLDKILFRKFGGYR